MWLGPIPSLNVDSDASVYYGMVLCPTPSSFLQLFRSVCSDFTDRYHNSATSQEGR